MGSIVDAVGENLELRVPVEGYYALSIPAEVFPSDSGLRSFPSVATASYDIRLTVVFSAHHGEGQKVRR